jgi:hypothetical protein
MKKSRKQGMDVREVQVITFDLPFDDGSNLVGGLTYHAFGENGDRTASVQIKKIEIENDPVSFNKKMIILFN